MIRLPIPPRSVLHRLAAGLAIASLAANPCNAASLQAEELQILGKALTFLEPPLTAPSVVAIVYSPGNLDSRRDAEGLAGYLNKMQLGGVSVTTRVVGAEALDTSDFQLIITADGVDGERVIAAANAHHVLCVTADVDAVRTGHCTMAIRSSRKVEIFVNRDAVRQSGIGFATAFRMMVHEQ